MTITYQPGMPPNPFLYTDFATPHPNFWVGRRGQNPPAFHTEIDQFCGVMATHWLTHGCSAGGLQFAQMPQGDRDAAVATMVQWAGGGGLAAQVTYASGRLGGGSMDRGTVIKNVQNRTFANHTRIWFGNDLHSEGAIYNRGSQASDDRYLCYDPNSGATTQRTGQQFETYIASKNAFVVRQ